MTEREKWGYEKADSFYYGMLKERARAMRNMPTEAEVQLWQELRDKKLGLRFRRQFVIGQYIADFVCLPLKLVIEVDGCIHQEQEQQEHDQQRDEWLAQEGYRVQRFTNDQVLYDTKKVIAGIKAMICALQNKI